LARTALNVTSSPSQTGNEGVTLMDAAGVSKGSISSTIWFEFTEVGAAQIAEDVI
jgi:hypothetical protein